jgi:preprotein translocase subunit SecY
LLSAIARVFRTPDLRRKLLFTLAIIAIYRVGVFIPTPGVDYGNVQQCLAAGNTTGGLYQFVNLFSGGALLQVSIFALGIMPYITASIIVQLLRVVIPRFEELHKEGSAGQSTLTQYTRYLTIALGLLQATTLVSLARSGNLFQGCTLPIIPDESIVNIILMVITLTAGTGLIMWFGELVTERGVGNGMSILIFISIAAGFPASMGAIANTQGWGVFAGVILIGLVVVVANFVPNVTIKSYATTAWLALLVFLIGEGFMLSRRLKREIATRFPAEKGPYEGQRGAIFYGIMRSFQLRRLRLPKPQVGPGAKV